MSILAIRCNSNLRVSCLQTPPPLRTAVQESRVELVLQHLFNCQRQNKNKNNLCKCYRNTVNTGDTQTSLFPIFFWGEQGGGGGGGGGGVCTWFFARQVWFVGVVKRATSQISPFCIIVAKQDARFWLPILPYLEVGWSPQGDWVNDVSSAIPLPYWFALTKG